MFRPKRFTIWTLGLAKRNHTFAVVPNRRPPTYNSQDFEGKNVTYELLCSERSVLSDALNWRLLRPNAFRTFRNYFSYSCSRICMLCACCSIVCSILFLWLGVLPIGDAGDVGFRGPGIDFWCARGGALALKWVAGSWFGFTWAMSWVKPPWVTCIT